MNTSLQFPERFRYQMNRCATFSLRDRGPQTLLSSSVSSDQFFCVAIFQGRIKNAAPPPPGPSRPLPLHTRKDGIYNFKKVAIFIKAFTQFL